MNPRFLALIAVVQLLSLVWLFCNPMVRSPPGSSVHGICQPRVLKWSAICYSRGSSQSSLLHWQADSLPLSHQGRSYWSLWTGEYKWSEVKVAQSCPTLCDPMDSRVQATGVGSLSLLQGIFPTQGSSQSRDRTQVSCIAGGFFTSWATREALLLTEVSASCAHLSFKVFHI